MFMIVTVKVRGTRGFKEIRHMCKKKRREKSNLGNKTKAKPKSIKQQFNYWYTNKVSQQGMAAK